MKLSSFLQRVKTMKRRDVIILSIILVATIGNIIFVAAMRHSSASSTANDNATTTQATTLESSINGDGSEATGATTTDPATSSQPSTSSANGAASTSSAAVSNKPKQNTTTSPAATPKPIDKSGYNLNQGWYMASVGVAGVFNKCWPTPLTVDNEAQCADMSHSLSDKLFVGLGYSTDPQSAVASASANAENQAAAAHVVPKRGGGDDPILLTESLCTQYSLSCGRW